MNKSIESIFFNVQNDIKKQINENSDMRKSFSYSEKQSLKTKYEEARVSQESYAGLSSFNESVVTNDSAIDFLSHVNIKTTFRSLFGKFGLQLETIGCHPNFHHLINSDNLDNGYSVTMFIDIVGSTKLGKQYKPEIVFNIKNTIIKNAIEIIQAFDGHVHRIMGDAVMAFFRSTENQNKNKQIDSAIDSLNCAIYIIEMMDSVINPLLNTQYTDEPIGVRVGIDYGKDCDIIWGNYGVCNAFEVTATSYYVDVAAKLQQSAKTNTIMIGENLKLLLGFGNDYIGYQIKKSNGIEKENKYVKPNYTINGEKINYKQYEVNNKKLFEYLPFGKNLNTKIKVKLLVKNKSNQSFEYFNLSSALDKHLQLSFHVEYTPDFITSGLYLKSVKQNTGPESASFNANSPITNKVPMELSNNTFYGIVNESTQYHGIHHMYLYIYDEQNNLLDKTCFSLYIS